MTSKHYDHYTVEFIHYYRLNQLKLGIVLAVICLTANSIQHMDLETLMNKEFNILLMHGFK